MIHKIMMKVLDDIILKEYTYFGLKNKNNFSTLLINKAIFGKYILYFNTIYNYRLI